MLYGAWSYWCASIPPFSSKLKTPMQSPFRTNLLLVVATFLFASIALGQQSGVVVLGEDDFEKAPNAAPVGSPAGSPRTSASTGGPGEVHVFDPRRDARADIRNALQVAARDGKHVLLDVGGDWCSFCKVLDNFFDQHPDVLALRNRNYVYVKVNFSAENQNPEALESYPLIRGFPHFFVLDATGKLVRSQRVALLGTQTGYSPERVRAFLLKAAPKR